MSVNQVHGSIELAPDHVYVIPPGRLLTMEETSEGVRLLVSERMEDRQRRFPIDRFFRSLAEVQGEDSVCIIFSGTGTDGTLGLKAVKEVAGLCLVQDPNEAEYDGMPRSAVGTGLVDVVDSVRGLARRVTSIVRRQGPARMASGSVTLDGEHEETLQSVIIELKRQTGHSFGGYKRATILRRLARRMQVAEIDDLRDYVDHLQHHPGEVHALFRDLLISVTSFFRGEEAFHELERRVIPEIFEDRVSSDPIRVWVPGCATGEEAFSIGMLLLEQRERLGGGQAIQVFATDVDTDALSFARTGHFPGSIASDVSAERLQRFFSMERNGYAVKQELMDILLFAEHNLASDPPFSKLDLVSCRNVLIYMGRALQEDVFARIHYALQDTGFLFLGPSESPDASSKLFRAFDTRQHIYQPLDVPVSATTSFPIKHRQAEFPKRSESEEPATGVRGLAAMHRSLVINEHAPPSVLVDEHGHVVHVTGDISPYVRLRTGLASFNLLDIIVPGLRLVIRPALFRATQGRRTSIMWEGALEEHAAEPEGRRLEPVDRSDRPSAPDADAPEEPPASVLQSLSMIKQALESDVERLKQATLEQFARLEEAAEANEENDENDKNDNGKAVTRLAITVEPVRERKSNKGYVLVVFSTKPPSDSPKPDWRIGHRELGDQSLFESMDEELRETQQRMRTLLEEYETSTEELQTSNEELQSMNEELRSATEELQVRKEELQSANEELLTVNEELSSKIEEVKRVNSDLENLMAATNIATIFLDRDLRVKRYTPQALDLFDIQVNGHATPIDRVSHVVTGVDIPAMVRRVFESLQPQRREVMAGKATYLMSVHPYRTPDDRIDGVVMTFVNITDRVELRAERDEAHETSALKSQMIANLSHEVRTPITALLGFSDALREEAQSPDARRFSEVIYNSTVRLQKTLESVLHFSRLDAGKESIERQEVDLLDEVRGIYLEQRGRAGKQGVELRLDMEEVGETLVCQTDGGALQRILRNLVGNAIKYTPEGGTVTIRCIRGPRGCMVDIEDTGIGMSLDFQRRMFDPFSQESAGHARQFEGVGLGLTIVRKLTELIGSTLEVESTPGMGTRFTLMLPRE